MWYPAIHELVPHAPPTNATAPVESLKPLAALLTAPPSAAPATGTSTAPHAAPVDTHTTAPHAPPTTSAGPFMGKVDMTGVDVALVRHQGAWVSKARVDV
jgi:hypothetical protein